MAETQYTYSISGNTALGLVNSDSLTVEIQASSIAENITRIETNGDDLDIYFANALGGGDVTELNGVVAAHTGDVPEGQEAQTSGVTRDPNANDDITEGFNPLDRWFNSSSQETFVCVDNTDGAAIWKRTTAYGLTENDSNVDGDQVDIDFTPSNYTPSTSPPEVTDTDHLSAHLAGIDTALAGVGSDDKRVKVSLDDTTPGFLEDKIVAGTNISITTLNAGGNETFEISATGGGDVDSVFGRTGVVVAQASDYDANQVDFTPNGDIVSTDVQTAIVEVRDDADTKLAGKASTSHASTHIKDGSDEIDGDQIDIDFTPSNYAPSTAPSEASDVDHLTAHLAGIDNALESIDAPALQVRLSAAVVLTNGGPFVDIEWPNIDIENEPATIERNDINTERIVFKATGLFHVQYNIVASLGGGDQCNIVAVLNNSTDIPGSVSVTDTGGFTSGDFSQNQSFIIDIQNINDYITIQAAGVGSVEIQEESTVVVNRLRGAKGEKGDTGVGSSIAVEEEGIGVSGGPFDTLNFIGSTVEATDGGGGVANITITAPSSGADGDAFCAYDSAGGQTFTGTITVNLDTEFFASSSNYTLSADQVTITEAGRYLITYECSVHANTNSRTQAQCFLEANTVEVTGTRSTLYCRLADYGATGSLSIVADAPAGVVIRLRATRTTGSATLITIASGTRLSIVRLT